MTQEELFKRIEGVDESIISRMSPEVLIRLTNNFKQQFVLKLVAKSKSNEGQRMICTALKKAYGEREKKSNPIWGMWGNEEYPEYLDNLQFDIECGRLITDEEAEQKKIDNDKKTDDYMITHKMTKEDIDNAILDAEIKNKAEKKSESTADFEACIKELEEENKRLKEGLAQKTAAVKDTDAIKVLKDENERLRQEHEEMIVELLKPFFYNSEQDVKEFLKEIDARPDTEIIDMVCEFLKARKLSDKSKGRPLWSVLHAAKYYSSTESNWNTALRNHQ